jgi:hypothetical protein
LKSWTYCRNEVPQWVEVIRKIVVGTGSTWVLVLRAGVVCVGIKG